MKTLELDLKKKILIIEGNHDDIDISENVILAMENLPKKVKLKFICKGSELTEEIASELVETHYHYEGGGEMYSNPEMWTNHSYCFHSAKAALIAEIKSKGFYWLENPLGNSKPKGILHSNGSEEAIKYIAENFVKKWQEAEAKTFKNPLIFELI